MLSEKIRSRSTELGTVGSTMKSRVLLLSETRDALLDSGSVPTFYRNRLNAETRCGGLDSVRQMSKPGEIWVEEDSDAPYRRKRLCQRFNPFAANLRLERAEPRGVPARLRETFNKTRSNRISHDHEHGRDAGL